MTKFTFGMAVGFLLAVIIHSAGMLKTIQGVFG